VGGGARRGDARPAYWRARFHVMLPPGVVMGGMRAAVMHDPLTGVRDSMAGCGECGDGRGAVGRNPSFPSRSTCGAGAGGDGRGEAWVGHDPLTGVRGSICARRGASRLVPAGCFRELDGWRAGQFSRFDSAGEVEEDGDAEGHYGATQEECGGKALLVDDKAAGD
jgi:hypothetical protein